MELSSAEIYLMVWACLATILAVLYRHGLHRHMGVNKNISVLLAGVVMGEITPKQRHGFWIVENEDCSLAFKVKGEDDGIQK